MKWVETRIDERCTRWDYRDDDGRIHGRVLCTDGHHRAKVWGPRWEEAEIVLRTLDAAQRHVRRRVESQAAGETPEPHVEYDPHDDRRIKGEDVERELVEAQGGFLPRHHRQRRFR